MGVIQKMPLLGIEVFCDGAGHEEQALGSKKKPGVGEDKGRGWALT